MGAGATQPRKRLGAWVARTNDTVYQAATDGKAVGSGVKVGGEKLTFTGYTDGSNPPTTRRVLSESEANVNIPIEMFVRQGNYWKIVASFGGAPMLEIGWIPLEP